MEKRINLLTGNIFNTLIKLAIPIMATSLIQMAYNMTDMLWTGRIGSGAVTAIGTAGMYLWIGEGIAFIPKIGGQVKAAQYLGSNSLKKAREIAKDTLQLTIFIALLYAIFLIIFNKPLIDFFNLENKQIVTNARNYLYITSIGSIFTFFSFIMTGLIIATGNSKVPFIANTIGLAFNILVDPLLIFGIGPFPKLGVLGAAIATTLAQLIVALVFVIYAIYDTHLFHNLKLIQKPNPDNLSNIIKIGFPTSIQSIGFTLIAMVISRFVVTFGDTAVAVQRVGSQVEALSWMTSDGFSASLNTFVAQNYGAGNIKRTKKGYKTAMKIIIPWGLFVSAFLIIFAAPIFGIFIPEANLIPMGKDYLQILGLSQLFMCIEIVTGGAFAGYGQTKIPSIISILGNLLRIPLAFILSSVIGLNGIWLAISLSSVIKGILSITIFKKKFL